MAIIVGIDEAGYGPLLGPLVVSSACFSVPDSKLSGSLWELLDAGVCLTKKSSKGRVIINDSKKLHHTAGDYSLLARSVLACRSASAENAAEMFFPETVRDFLTSVGFNQYDMFNDYPWYYDLLDTALEYDRADTAIAGSGLWRAMKKCDVALKYLLTTPMDVGSYNDSVSLTGNKAVVLFNLACRHIFHAWENHSHDKLNVVVDKQGGRANYRDKLQKLFPYAKLNEIKQTPQISSYHMFEGNRSMKIHFIAKGDQKQLPVALASMLSKLVREIMVEHLNRYFDTLVPGIKPTAGYYQDGTRFLQDIKNAGQYPPPALIHRLIRQK